MYIKFLKSLSLTICRKENIWVLIVCTFRTDFTGVFLILVLEESAGTSDRSAGIGQAVVPRETPIVVGVGDGLTGGAVVPRITGSSHGTQTSAVTVHTTITGSTLGIGLKPSGGSVGSVTTGFRETTSCWTVMADWTVHLLGWCRTLGAVVASGTVSCWGPESRGGAIFTGGTFCHFPWAFRAEEPGLTLASSGRGLQIITKNENLSQISAFILLLARFLLSFQK